MKHRSKVSFRTDFNKPWSLPFFGKGRKNRFVIVKCTICNPPKGKFNRAKSNKALAKLEV